MPARPVEHHDGVAVGRDGRGEVEEEAVHGLGADPWQNEAEVLAGRGPDGGKKVGRGEALVAKPWWALAPHPPAVAGPALLTNASLPRVKPEGRL